ncbi:HAD-IIIA family hydrolase [Vibrio owensii]|uniref:HAD-IIIA family hydrolase n=1 Tax=Vibrio owensii TaxID=696485 RepID=A0AAP9GBL4_9VIBR|nr:HAD-IIIA family hydrolase [Vibrio owensii]QGH46852.1 HAD-IIIA family hydrolase [Vibrio owensii]QGH46878.1 HAD-IIIA family hydrolase [Vibrio owensii]
MDLNRYELVIFDADDTLRECTVEGQFYPLAQGEWVLKGDVCDVLSKYDWTSKKFGIATNQPGISRGELTEEVSLQLLNDMVIGVFGFLPDREAIQFCPHAIDGECDCRKPAGGMLKRIIAHFGVEPASTVFVGDRLKDKIVAESASCGFIWVHDLVNGSSKS